MSKLIHRRNPNSGRHEVHLSVNPSAVIKFSAGTRRNGQLFIDNFLVGTVGLPVRTVPEKIERAKEILMGLTQQTVQSMVDARINSLEANIQAHRNHIDSEQHAINKLKQRFTD